VFLFAFKIFIHCCVLQLSKYFTEQTNTHRMAAPFGTCIDAAEAASDMNVYAELYPIKYDHIVSHIGTMCSVE
jgi:hypothetical protein